MVAISKASKLKELSSWQTAFLTMLPAIRRYARAAFRGLPAQRREDAVSEVVANCCVAVWRLAEQGKLDDAHPSVLANYAIRHYCAGREIGARLNVRDVSSRYAQQQKQFCVERLDRYDLADDAWREIVVEDRCAGPAEIAATRIDFSEWLAGLTKPKRKIAELLATGESTTEVAQQFGVTAGRVSQLRRELQNAWHEFQGEAVPK